MRGLKVSARRQGSAWIGIIAVDGNKDPRALRLCWQTRRDTDGDGRKQGEEKCTRFHDRPPSCVVTPIRVTARLWLRRPHVGHGWNNAGKQLTSSALPLGWGVMLDGGLWN